MVPGCRSSEVTMLAIAALACAAWTFALLLRGGFWRATERDDDAPRRDVRTEGLAAHRRRHAGPE